MSPASSADGRKHKRLADFGLAASEPATPATFCQALVFAGAGWLFGMFDQVAEQALGAWWRVLHGYQVMEELR